MEIAEISNRRNLIAYSVSAQKTRIISLMKKFSQTFFRPVQSFTQLSITDEID